MLSKSPDQHQGDLFRPLLRDFIDPAHELVLLADKIDWSYFEKSFASLYSHTGKPSMPIRLMVGCLLLKRLYDLGDESLAKTWVMNPYMQYFCGRAHFEHQFPCDPSDLVHFRHRIGEAGVAKIFNYSVEIHGDSVQEAVVLSDTTVQENNTTYPTDAKLYAKIIDYCRRIAQEVVIEQRQSYVRVSKQHLRNCYNANHPRRAKKAKKARKKLRTIGYRVVRELERKIPKDLLPNYQSILDLFTQVLNQEKKDKNKIYSLHKSFTACIAKGKAGRTYEYGNKVGLVVGDQHLVILGIKAFTGNPHDSKTIEPLLSQMETHLDYLPKEVVYDRGGKGQKKIKGVTISTPGKPLKKDSAYQKRKKRKKFRRRAAIEPIIGHLKMHYRMGQNYLHGKSSPQINAFLAAAGWNLRKYMQKLKLKYQEDFNQLQLLLFNLFLELGLYPKSRLVWSY